MAISKADLANAVRNDPETALEHLEAVMSEEQLAAFTARLFPPATAEDERVALREIQRKLEALNAEGVSDILKAVEARHDEVSAEIDADEAAKREAARVEAEAAEAEAVRPAEEVQAPRKQ